MKLKNEKDIYTGCKERKGKWQKELFDQTADYMRAVCMRYASCADEADDILQDGYIKVFGKIDQLEWQGDGSVYGWVKRIMVNTAIDQYRNQISRKTDSIDEQYDLFDETVDSVMTFEDSDMDREKISVQAIYDTQLSGEELVMAVGLLPQPLRLTFNLFAIEGMKHRDIADMLGIPIKTSTTRVLRAKHHLQGIIAMMCAEKLTQLSNTH